MGWLLTWVKYDAAVTEHTGVQRFLGILKGGTFLLIAGENSSALQLCALPAAVGRQWWNVSVGMPALILSQWLPWSHAFLKDSALGWGWTLVWPACVFALWVLPDTTSEWHHTSFGHLCVLRSVEERFQCYCLLKWLVNGISSIQDKFSYPEALPVSHAVCPAVSLC